MLRHRVLATVLALCAPLDSATSQPIPQAAIDSLVTREMQARRIPGVAIAVVDNGKITFKRAYGIANLEQETPVTLNSVFELASVTKQFTAAAIMMLVEEGKVRLDDPINGYLDQPPEIWKSLTVRQLLTHTAGLASSAVVNHQGSPLLYISTKQAYDFIASQPLFLAPGTHGFYADAGYFLLGMIIEKASGLSYRAFVQRRIFDPLQMTQSSVLDKVRVLKGRVATYEFRGDTLVNWRRDWNYQLPSFFGIFSTLDDLAKWDAALRTETLLKSASLEQMWTPGTLSTGRHAMVLGDLYGFGFLLGDIRGHRFAAHGGASGTYLLHFLDSPLSIVILTNLSSTAGRHAPRLARQIASLVKPQYRSPEFLAPQPDPQPEVTAALRALLPELPKGQVSDFMTPAHKSYFKDMPASFRARTYAPLGAVTTLTHIACDDVDKRGIRYTDAVARICYYKGEGSGRARYVTVWLTKEGKAAHLTFDGNG
jgi:CubicO group peptidase (beta-lactamase class C family)